MTPYRFAAVAALAVLLLSTHATVQAIGGVRLIEQAWAFIAAPRMTYDLNGLQPGGTLHGPGNHLCRAARC